MTDTVDLTAVAEVTTRLLDVPLAWRVRVVEQIDVDSPTHALRRRSLQCAPLRPVIADLLERTDGNGARTSLLVLPVAPIPKGPLLDLDIEGPEGSQAFLLQRADIAALEAAFLDVQARRAGVTLDPRTRQVIEYALGFSGAQWQRFRPDVPAYLADGLADPDPSVVSRWIDESARVAETFSSFADVPDPLDSAVENPSLVIPSLVEALAWSPEDVTGALSAFHRTMRKAASVASGEDERGFAARIFLESLVEYGTHYDLMAVVHVPLDEPFLVKIRDRRPLRLTGLRNEGTQSVVVNDARSNHLALRVTDPNAELSDVEARTPGGDRLATGTFGARSTPEVHSVYAFEPDRTYRIALTFRVAALARLRFVPYALALGLVVMTMLIVAVRPGRRDLALLAGPATFAASILLIREPSALGSHLRRVGNVVVVSSVVALLAVAAYQFIRLSLGT